MEFSLKMPHGHEIICELYVKDFERNDIFGHTSQLGNQTENLTLKDSNEGVSKACFIC